MKFTKLWLIVDADELSLPVAVFDSALSCSIFLNRSPRQIRRAVQTGCIVCKKYRVEAVIIQE